MTIDEVIKTLEEMRNTNLNYYSRKRRAALKLSIEALKLIKKNRELVRERGGVSIGLPGETAE